MTPGWIAGVCAALLITHSGLFVVGIVWGSSSGRYPDDKQTIDALQADNDRLQLENMDLTQDNAALETQIDQAAATLAEIRASIGAPPVESPEFAKAADQALDIQEQTS